MGRKKKRAAPNPRERIFCYYCDRTFNTEQELLMHQREKHLRCPTCNKRMLSIPSLTIHSEQMHNTTVASVPNAIEGRNSTHVDVLGMKGVPDEYYQALEGKANKKSSYSDAYYQPYSQQQAYPPSQGYAALGYYQQGYAAQPYSHGYNHQYPPQHGYNTTAYPTQSYPSQGYAYQAHHGYANSKYASQAASYPQQTSYPAQAYGPQQPAVQSQPQPTQQYSSSSPAYSQPASSATTQPQTNGPRPVSDEKPPSLAPKKPEIIPTQTPKAADLPATTHVPPEKPKTQSEPGIIIIFDRTDLCMEELRAQLPQYRVSAPKS